jgi:flagellar basal-body rod protein FlgC
MNGISAIAVSGMNAAAQRLDVAASNVANAFTTGALPAANGAIPAGAPQAYTALRVDQTAAAGGGTQTTVTATNPSYVAAYSPQASFANQDGLVAAPNVDTSQDMVGQMIASYSFSANAAMLTAADRMSKMLLDTLA